MTKDLCERIFERLNRKFYKYYVTLRNMEMISKVSRGSKMDQIYIPKNRGGFGVGSYVVIRPLQSEEVKVKDKENFYFYGINNISPIKIRIISEVIKIIERDIEYYDNLIFTGSFLDEGFRFNDVDIIIVSGQRVKLDRIKSMIFERIGVIADILVMSNKELVRGLETDPLYQMMLSKCVAKKRFVYKTNRKINYKLLDLHLLKSKVLIDNFDFLKGDEKYDLVRNMIAILLFLEGKKISRKVVDDKIRNSFFLKEVNEIKQNIINKKKFLKRFKEIYNKTFNKILKGIEEGSE